MIAPGMPHVLGWLASAGLAIAHDGAVAREVQEVACDPAAQLAFESAAVGCAPEWTDFDLQGAAAASLANDPFAKGTLIASGFLGAAIGDEQGDVFTAHAGVGYHVMDNVSANLYGVFAFADNARGKDSLGLGADLLLRWHFWRSERWSAYIDGGCGIIGFTREFPTHGTNLNFTLQAGVGFTYELRPDLLLMAGAKWYHISNARINGFENNIGLDAPAFYLGVMAPF